MITQQNITTRSAEINSLLQQDNLSFELRQILVQDQLRLLYQRDFLKEN